jgi:hypothetical protein
MFNGHDPGITIRGNRKVTAMGKEPKDIQYKGVVLKAVCQALVWRHRLDAQTEKRRDIIALSTNPKSRQA